MAVARSAASGTGSWHGGPQADVEAFTEIQWVTLRGDLPAYPLWCQGFWCQGFWCHAAQEAAPRAPGHG